MLNAQLATEWCDNCSDLHRQHHSQLEHAPVFTRATLLRVIVLAAMAVISMIGNIATMYNIHRWRMSRRIYRHNWSAIYLLIFHLAISDVLVTWFCIIGEAFWYYTVQWVAGDLACKLVKFFQMFSLYLSTYVLVLIAVDRWIAVKFPMKSLNMSKRCNNLLLFVYCLAFGLSVPQLIIFHVAQGPFQEEFYQCVTHGFYGAKWQEQLYTLFTLIFMFVIPLALITVSYMLTFKTISGSARMFEIKTLPTKLNCNVTSDNRQRLLQRAKMKSLRISVVIVVAFIICWTPYYIRMLISIFLDPNETISEDLESAIFFFGMSNSLVNPLIYGAFQLWPSKRVRNVSQTSFTSKEVNGHRGGPVQMRYCNQRVCNNNNGGQTELIRL